MGRTHFTLGTELGISVGPLGRTAGSDLRAGKGGVAAAFAYAHSRGLFVGVSVETGVVVGRPDVNTAFYGTSETVRGLLTGRVPPPKGAHILYKALKEVKAARHSRRHLKK
jgi:lipid-binding SYLF domain-containing protein